MASRSFSCINQDGAPAIELEERMASLVGMCDLILTPIVDPMHEEWALPLTFHNGIDDYKAEAWQEYWSRAWCRVEAFLAVSVPIDHSNRENTAHKLRGGIRVANDAGRRPHAIFGTKELTQVRWLCDRL